MVLVVFLRPEIGRAHNGLRVIIVGLFGGVCIAGFG